MKKLNKRNEGFTLVEVIAVLVILGILAAVAVPKYIDLQENAEIKALDAGVAEYNGREAMRWGDTLLSDVGWTGDITIDRELGDDYTAAAAGGGTLGFRSKGITLTRSNSTATAPGLWIKGAIVDFTPPAN